MAKSLKSDIDEAKLHTVELISSFPFTAPANGLIYVAFTGSCYAYFASNAGESFRANCSATNMSSGLLFPAIKGITYSLVESESTITYYSKYFYKLG